MTAPPPLTITIEPKTCGTVHYLPLAASAVGEPAQFKLALRLRIRNNGPGDVFLSGISFAFPGFPHPAKDMQGVRLAMSYPGVPKGDPPAPKDGKIAPGNDAIWSSGLVNLTPGAPTATWIRNDMYGAQPAPSSMTVQVWADGFPDPAEHSEPLGPFPIPAMALPFKVEDLREGEFACTSAEHSSNGGPNGGQIYAHDISITGRTASGTWDDRLDPSMPWSPVVKENHRIWDKPIYAMAPGTVTDVRDGVEDNAGGEPAGGNAVTIDHGLVSAVYCHLRKGSVEVTKGQVVAVGTRLGRIGWSGNTSHPHTHIALTTTYGGLLWGLAFADAHVLDLTKVAADGTGPWVPMEGAGIPRKLVALWPSATPPGATAPEPEPEPGPEPEPEPEPDDPPSTLEELLALLQGGLGPLGPGFVVLGNKVVKVSPRSRSWKLLQAVVAREDDEGRGRRRPR